MRTNIEIDDTLMRDTLQATGLKTKREAVELGLRTLLRLRQQAQLRSFRGKLEWQGDLDAMRRDPTQSAAAGDYVGAAAKTVSRVADRASTEGASEVAGSEVSVGAPAPKK